MRNKDRKWKTSVPTPIALIFLYLLPGYYQKLRDWPGNFFDAAAPSPLPPPAHNPRLAARVHQLACCFLQTINKGPPFSFLYPQQKRPPLQQQLLSILLFYHSLPTANSPSHLSDLGFYIYPLSSVSIANMGNVINLAVQYALYFAVPFVCYLLFNSGSLLMRSRLCYESLTGFFQARYDITQVPG